MMVEPLAVACITMLAVSGYLAFDAYRNRRGLQILSEYITEKDLYDDYMEWIDR